MAKRYSDPKKAGALMEADASDKVLRELDRLIDKYVRHVDKEADKRREEFELVMGYRSEADIQEAYGWEFITQAQYERYLEIFRAGNSAMENHEPTVTERALAILRAFRWDLLQEQQEYRYEAMSPDELRAEIQRRQAAEREWNERMKELRARRRSIEDAGGTHT